MIIIVMGVSGCGKTTIGTMLARRLELPYFDADEFHPPANVEKMSAGIPLTDEDRWPWLDAIVDAMGNWEARGGAVLGCSALRRSYRRKLATVPGVVFVFLRCTREVLLERLKHRAGHFMKAVMLDSQLSTLEAPADAIVVNGDLPCGEVVELVIEGLGEVENG